jgi:hypothetical protein
MDVDQVRQALASTAAAAFTGVTGYDYVPDAVTTPAFVVGDNTVDYLQTFGTDDNLTFLCRILLDRADGDGKTPQRILGQYMSRTGDLSVKAALESEPTLGGVCDDLVVRGARGPRAYTIGNQNLIGAEFTVQVIGD